MEKLDLKKTLKSFYDAKPAPAFLDIPMFNFLMIDGKGNPNTSTDYIDVIQALYSTAYTLKFKVKKELEIDYPVMFLEGLWWMPDMNLFSVEQKENWLWTMMISTPDFITPILVADALAEAGRKKSLPALARLRFESFSEGPSAQLMHIGSYSAETENIQRLHAFIQENGRSFDGINKKHHEIYISDPNRTAQEKMKTIIRQPVKS
ncbi:MAG: GyrI-like domain-containing protein [Chloroflexi bacterium]|nr:GyrI-like domain-containing protein [Chloroflexota bacterium]